MELAAPCSGERRYSTTWDTEGKLRDLGLHVTQSVEADEDEQPEKL